MPLIFVRHGESVGNTINQDERAALNIPNHEYPLTNLGIRQAQIVGEYLADRFGLNAFSHVYDSDFLRSQQTLDLILQRVGNSSLRRRDSRLNEKWDGIFHDLTKEEVQARYPDQLRLRKRTGYYLYRAPGGESCPDVEVRIRSFNQDVLATAQNPNCCVLVVGHGRWHLIFQKVLRNWTVGEFLRRKKEEKQYNCMVAVYEGAALLDTPPNHEGVEPECSVPWRGVLPEALTEHA